MRFAERRVDPAVELLRRFVAPERLALVDVGSAGGIEPEWKRFRRDIRFVGFEPDRREFQRLSSGPHEIHLPYVVAARPEPQTLYVSREPARTSVYRPNLAFLRQFPRVERFETVREVRVEATDVTTLAEALPARDIRDPDFLKLDTQGSELGILAGAGDLLSRHVLGIRVEVEFAELYAGQPLFADVDAFLRRRGFVLWDLRRYYWKRRVFTNFRGHGQLVFGDALYLKDDEAFFGETIRGSASPRSKLARFLVVCLVYRAPDYAVSLVRRAKEVGVADEEFSSAVERMIISRYRSRWSLPGARRAFSRIARLERRFVTSFLGFADADVARW